MIQRQQTLWLLLSTIAALLTFLFPFVTGQVLEGTVQVFRSVDARGNFQLLLLTAASMIISGSTIFLYKDRKLQMKLCLLGILVTAGIITLYIVEMNKLSKATLALSSLFLVLILLGYVMAYRNIRKDEKLVRSLDKIR